MSYPITGILKKLGPAEFQVPLRRELDEWWQSKDENDLNQRSLFIYALYEFQQMSPDDKLSYFQVAGIHGQPLKPWDAATATKDDFYCPHSTTLFPTWHRPYVLLYEQRIYETMIKIIPEKFAESDWAAMTEAAETWRLPYWDWAERKPDWRNPDNPWGPNVPYLATLAEVEVKTKFGNGVTNVPNPLWKYTIPGGKSFEQIDSTFTEQEGFPYQVCKSTSKQPAVWDPKHADFESDWVNGMQQNVDKISSELQGPMEKLYNNTLPESVYRLFLESNMDTYDKFASDGYKSGQPASSYSSLEDVHNRIHMLAGGNGQMSQLSVAAYDPIFWMHHCNIDRYLAIWLELYPNKYLEVETDDQGHPKQWNGKTIGPELPLHPFHKDTGGGFINSADVRYPYKLGYTYPELQRWLPKYQVGGVFNLEAYQKDIRAKIELAYSTTGKSTLQLDRHADICEFHLSKLSKDALEAQYFPVALVEKAQELHEHPIPLPSLAQVGSDWKENDFVVNILYERFALNGSPFSIRIFLGPVPEEGQGLSFADNPSQIGHIYNFSAPINGRGATEEGCEGCKTQMDDHHKATGQIVLTDHLVAHVKDQEEQNLTGLSKDQVVGYLRDNLHWRIADFNDNLIPKDSMPSLKISVAMGKATHFLSETRFSKYENYEILWEVTDGRRCGAAPEDLGLHLGGHLGL